MAYCTFATSKFHCFKSEDESLSLMERKVPVNSVFVVNGIKTFKYKEIKLRGVEACIGDVRRLIKEGKIGNVYKEVYHQVDEQYFTENDYGMLAAYFDEFLKEVYLILNPGIKKNQTSSEEKKKVNLQKQKINLQKQIEELQKELKKTEGEIGDIDIVAIESDVAGEETFKNAPTVPLS